MKEIFDFNNYVGNYVMSCNTENEAKDFCKILELNLRKWKNNEDYLKNTNWYPYQYDTVYHFNEGMFGHKDRALKENAIILNYADFIWNDDIFTKKNLKTLDLIVRRNGKIERVNLSEKNFLAVQELNNLDNINNDLTCTNNDNSYDIVKVYRPILLKHMACNSSLNNCGILLYER